MYIYIYVCNSYKLYGLNAYMYVQFDVKIWNIHLEQQHRKITTVTVAATATINVVL